MIIKINNEVYIKYNEETQTSETLNVSDLEVRKQELELSLQTKTDEELLAWAKANYFTPDMLLDIEKKQGELVRITNTLNEIYGD